MTDPEATHATPSGDGFRGAIRRFISYESSSGMLLMAAAVLAMLIKNSPLSELYLGFLELRGTIEVGPLSISKPAFLWINDAWMAVFFFLVGMDIKREMLYGQLADRSQLVLPVAGAFGGMLVPGTIYYLLNAGDPVAANGWAIPTATDIAFALGVVAMLGSRVPVSLKILLMTLAVLDDLGAIMIIALFYTSKLTLVSLAWGAVFVAGLFVLNRYRVVSLAAYVLMGAALWICVLKSGVHATLAGVVTAFFIPARLSADDDSSLLEHTIHMLHPWVSLGILPMFAFVNAGIALEGLDVSAMTGPVPMGIFLGLLIGKPVGIVLFSGVAVWAGLTSLPPGVRWRQMIGLGFLCGIGFTMSIFVASLAFQEAGIGYTRVDRLAIIAASLIAGAVGYAILRATSPGAASPSGTPHTQD